MLTIIGLLLLGCIAYCAWRMTVRPEVILGGLAMAVSISSINIHVGATIYFSRLMVIALLAVTVIRTGVGVRSELHTWVDHAVLTLFAATICVQFVSLQSAPSPPDGLRQIFINLSMMAIFIVVGVLATNVRGLLNALDLFVLVGAIQGAVGIYQVVGVLKGWPMYQDFLVGIPVGNPRNELREFWFSGLSPRAFGFFADPGHYAGYLACVLVFALAMLTVRHRPRLAYVAIAFGTPGLLLSLSRSGILAFFGIGLPLLLLLMPKMGVSRARVAWPVIATALSLAGALEVMLLVFPSIAQLAARIDIWSLLAGRLADIVGAAGKTGDSMQLHIQTRLIALDAFRTSPVVGIGIGNAPFWVSPTLGVGWGGAHSHHLNMLGETGLLGAFCEWATMWYIARRMWLAIPFAPPRSHARMMMVALFVSYITIILGNFMYEYYFEDFVWFLMGSGLAMARILEQKYMVRTAIATAA
jgi:hypothetical protein